MRGSCLSVQGLLGRVWLSVISGKEIGRRQPIRPVASRTIGLSNYPRLPICAILCRIFLPKEPKEV